MEAVIKVDFASLAKQPKLGQRYSSELPLCPRSAHAALNTLLQSAGAVVMKQACVIAHKNFKVPVQQVATVHDEYQFIVSPSDAEDIGKIVVQAIEQA